MNLCNSTKPHYPNATCVGILAMALAGCGPAGSTPEDLAPLAQNASVTVGGQRESAGGLDRDVSSTFTFNDTEHGVDSADHYESVVEGTPSWTTLVDRATRTSRRIAFDEFSAQFTVWNGAQQVSIRVDTIGHVLVNGQPSQGYNDAARIALSFGSAYQGMPLPILIEIDRRLGAMPSTSIRFAPTSPTNRASRCLIRALVSRLPTGGAIQTCS